MKQYFSFQWHITDACDQRCKHCYIFSEDTCKHLDSMTWGQMSDTFFNCLDFCRVYDRLPYFYITGGDPILHPQFWKLAGLLKERALLLLLPLYPIGYVCTRLSRRTGLGRSLALTLPLSLLGALGVAVLGWWMAGRGTPLEALRSFRFYEALWPALCGALRAAVTLPGRFSPSELALGALAVLTLPELLHGLCRGRDLRCAMILLLLASAAALWALSGLFLLPLPLAMALAWVWQRLCDRGAAVSAAVPAAVLALCAVSSILFMF